MSGNCRYGTLRDVRFLIDNNLSPRLSGLLVAAGHDAAHVRDYGLQAVSDPDVMDRAPRRTGS